MTTPHLPFLNRLLGHTVTYIFTAQMCENEFCTLVHGKRSVNIGPATFEKLKEEGTEANLVFFGEEVQELKPKLFAYVRQTLEDQVKRNDTGTQLLQNKSDAARMNGLAPNPTIDTITLLDVSKNTPTTETAASEVKSKPGRKRKADSDIDKSKPKKRTKIIDDKPSKKLTALRAKQAAEDLNVPTAAPSTTMDDLSDIKF